VATEGRASRTLARLCPVQLDRRPAQRSAGNLRAGGRAGTIMAGSKRDLQLGSRRAIAADPVLRRGAAALPHYLIGEKSSLKDVLLPIAQDIGTELLLPTGEASDTLIADMAARAVADGRPAIVLYFSDFDPAGAQMPVSVARKLQGLRALDYPELQIEVHSVALTIDQVRELNLPSTPLKDTERRADKWRARYGHEQTEIDALAALRPDDLRQIARDAIAPYYDRTLLRRTIEARSRWRATAETQLGADPAYIAARDELTSLLGDLNDVIEQISDIQERTELAVELPPLELPQPRITTVAPTPLFTTAWDFVIATRRLIAAKRLDGSQ
jgi:hypothetical protein